MPEEVQVRVSAPGAAQTAAELREVEAASRGVGSSGANPAGYRRPEGTASRRGEISQLEREITLTSELEMAELRRAGDHAGANKIAEELELMREQFAVQRTLNTGDEESLAIAQQRLAVRREETAAREAAAVAAKETAAADAADTGGSGGGLNPAALRGGRLGSIGRALGMDAGMANPIAMAVMAAIGLGMAQQGDMNRQREFDEENDNRAEELRRQRNSLDASTMGAATQITDRPEAGARAAVDNDEAVRDLQNKLKHAKADPLPMSAWLTNFRAKWNQSVDPRAGAYDPNDPQGKSQERADIRAQIADLNRASAADRSLAGPQTDKGRRWMDIFNRLTDSGVSAQGAESAADNLSGVGDLRKFGSATRGGARLATVAAGLRGGADQQVGQMIAAQNRTNDLLSGMAHGHVNPNARTGPTGLAGVVAASMAGSAGGHL